MADRLLQTGRKRPGINPRSYPVALASNYAVMVVSGLVQLAVVPLYLQTIGTDGFGSLAMLLSTVHLASAGLLWISGGGARVLAEKAAHEAWAEASTVYSLVEGIYLLYGLLVALLLLVLTAGFGNALFLFPSGMSNESMWLLAISVSLYLLLQFDFSFQQLAYEATKFHWIGNLLQVGSALLFLVFIVPALLHAEEIYVVFFCLAASIFCMRLVSWYGWRFVRRKGVEIRFRVSWTEFRTLLRHLFSSMGMHFSIYGVIAKVGQIDTLLVGLLGGSYAAGLFALLMKIPYLCIQMIWRMASTAEPYFIHYDARDERGQLVRAFRKGLVITVTGSVAMGGGFMLLGPWVLNLWVGEEHSASLSRMSYLLAGMAVVWIGATRWTARVSFALLELKGLVFVTSVEVAAKIGLMLILFDMTSYLAPLWAINIEFVAGVVILYIWLARKII